MRISTIFIILVMFGLTIFHYEYKVKIYQGYHQRDINCINQLIFVNDYNEKLYRDGTVVSPTASGFDLCDLDPFDTHCQCSHIER